MKSHRLVVVIALLLALAQNIQAETPEEIFLNETYYTGFIPITNDSDIFYWWFPSLTNPETDPLVFWLTGGPGCSSEVALFYENGPFTINQNLTLKKNPYTWSNSSNLVFVDQPVGTGFSESPFSEMSKNEVEVAQNFQIFLEGFLEKFPEFKNREIFITGESYAGHYIPAIGAQLKKNNFNLVGVAIGNGWTDPYYQYPQYAEFALENKLVTQHNYYLLWSAYKVCQGLILAKLPWIIPLEVCQLATQFILGNPISPNFNVYDIRQKCEHPPLCYDFDLVGDFLKRIDVIYALGVQGRKWTDCNMVVHTKMLGDWLTNLSGDVSYLLEQGLKVLVYSGDQDFICNWLGGQAWTNRVQWSKKIEFQNAPYNAWNVDGIEHGSYKQVDNFVFLRVYDAGHMVPMDQPKASLEMLNQFINPWAKEVREFRLLKEQSEQ